MNVPNVSRRVLLLIGATTVLLAAALGAIDWYVETEKVDDAVVALAQGEARALTDDKLQLFASAEAGRQLAALFVGDKSGNFPIIELYDSERRKILEVIAPGREAVEKALRQFPEHGFPPGNEARYRRLRLLGGSYIQVLLPLRDGKGQLAGYFEGVYQIPVATLKAIESGVFQAVAMVILSVLVTGAVIYPIVARLHRHILATSRTLLRGNLELMAVMGAAVAKRDSDTSAHNYRVTAYALALGRRAGLSATQLRELIAGAFLHDVGKIGIPDAILLKPGKLTPQEFETMKQHVVLGREILLPARWLAKSIDVTEFHHEKFDGSGYLRGLKGDEIPLTARVFAVADVFDALASRRPYKEAMPPEEALSIMRGNAGSHFDPELFALFEKNALAWYGEIGGLDEAGLLEHLRREAGPIFGLPANNKE